MFSFPKFPAESHAEVVLKNLASPVESWGFSARILGSKRIQSSQVMMTETGPCLVEVNSRCHGAAGSWMPLARALTGYTQASAMAVKIHPFEVPFSDHMTYSQFVGPQMNRSNRFHQARFPAATQVDACVDAFLDENAFAGLWTVDCEVKPFQAISGSTPKWPSLHLEDCLTYHCHSKPPDKCQCWSLIMRVRCDGSNRFYCKICKCWEILSWKKELRSSKLFWHTFRLEPCSTSFLPRSPNRLEIHHHFPRSYGNFGGVYPISMAWNMKQVDGSWTSQLPWLVLDWGRCSAIV
jgi:drug/metabolite transporter superfamily protein YnfA